MRHNVSGRKFDRPTGQRMSLYRNLVTDLLNYEEITISEPRAKEIRSMAEKMITLGKKGTLASRRRALAFVYMPGIVEKVFEDLSKRYAERPGGYTRMTKLGPRQGDGAEMVKLELIK